MVKTFQKEKKNTIEARAEGKNLQLIIEELAGGEISSSEAQPILEEIWREAYSGDPLRDAVREVFPSLSKTHKLI